MSQIASDGMKDRSIMAKWFLARPLDGATASALLDPATYMELGSARGEARCLAAAIGIAIGTGARPEEIETLEIEDLIRTGKPPTIQLAAHARLSGRHLCREVPLIPAILAPLDAYISQRPSTDPNDRRLFLAARNVALSRKDVRNAMDRFDRSRRRSGAAVDRSLRLTFRHALFQARVADDTFAYLMGQGASLRKVSDRATLRARRPDAVLKILERSHVLGRLHIMPEARDVPEGGNEAVRTDTATSRTS